MRYLLACNCRFECKTTEPAHGHAARYILTAEGVDVGAFDYFAIGSRPQYELSVAWKLSGAMRPWEDDEDT